MCTNWKFGKKSHTFHRMSTQFCHIWTLVTFCLCKWD